MITAFETGILEIKRLFAVLALKELHEQGLSYVGKRAVLWCS
jgi:hypothetical protein